MVRQITWLGTLLAFTFICRPADAALTLRLADRVIDRAFQAELAGDYPGAKTAVLERIESATLPEEAPGRSRLEAWLSGMETREAAFQEAGRTAAGYWRAFRTLKSFRSRHSGLLWRRALRDLPGLEAHFSQYAKIVVRFERVSGVGDVTQFENHLSARLMRVGMSAVSDYKAASYEVRIYLDASEADDLLNRSRVTVESSYLLREANEVPQLVGTFAKRRGVIRTTEGAARRFGVRRVVDDIARALTFQIREAALKDFAQP